MSLGYNEASITNDLGRFVLDTVRLIMEFERSLMSLFRMIEAEKIQTVGQAIDYIVANQS